MSLAISGNSLSSLFDQQSYSSFPSNSQSSSGSSSTNMDDTYTPSSSSNEYYDATVSAIHQMDNQVSVQLNTTLTAQSDATVSNVMAMFGI